MCLWFMGAIVRLGRVVNCLFKLVWRCFIKLLGGGSQIGQFQNFGL